MADIVSKLVNVETDSNESHHHRGDHDCPPFFVKQPSGDCQAHGFGGLRAIGITVEHPVVVHLFLGESLVGQDESLVAAGGSLLRNLSLVDLIRMVFN